MNKKRKIIIAVIIIVAILIVVFGILLYSRKTHPIKHIRFESLNPGHVNLAWSDDDDHATYMIFWSNKPGINVHDPQTYKYSKYVGGLRTIIYAPYNYVYFRITKEGFVSKEYIAPVKTDKSFCSKNLETQTIKVGNPIVINVNVLENAEVYRVYSNVNDGEIYYEDFNVLGLDRTNLKITTYPDAIMQISYIKRGEESDTEFLMYNETDLERYVMEEKIANSEETDLEKYAIREKIANSEETDLEKYAMRKKIGNSEENEQDQKDYIEEGMEKVDV